uniref:Uncharacterized protein n=1 Tax=Arundo donax TaxID=35708 RepID=A0A0A9BR18_ARUDO
MVLQACIFCYYPLLSIYEKRRNHLPRRSGFGGSRSGCRAAPGRRRR